VKATSIEFRFRVLIITIIITLGFWAPWIESLAIGRRISVLEWLALELSRTGLVTFTVATPLVIVLASLIAAKGAALRIWGTAYLGAFTVNHKEMQAAAVIAAGPYRYVRNPLYLGSWCMFAAMAFIMPPTGALFALLLVTVFQLRLIFGEEAF
jgi:protein-S-isoprenylcysteine O-methyltransferase Ste14